MKKNPFVFAAFLTLASACPAGCRTAEEDPGGEDSGGDQIPDPDAGSRLRPTGALCPEGGSSLTYESFGRPFVEDYCLRCHSEQATGPMRHGAPPGENFDSHIEIQAHAGHMDALAGAGPDSVNELMPPDEPRPTLAERQMLSEWLSCGSP